MHYQTKYFDFTESTWIFKMIFSSPLYNYVGAVVNNISAFQPQDPQFHPYNSSADHDI